MDSLHSVKGQTMSISLPPAVVKRLDEMLHGALKDGGYGTIARHEIIGALILSAESAADTLFEQIRLYRRARVEDALPGAHREIIEFPRKRAGRPRKS